MTDKTKEEGEVEEETKKTKISRMMRKGGRIIRMRRMEKKRHHKGKKMEGIKKVLNDEQAI